MPDYTDYHRSRQGGKRMTCKDCAYASQPTTTMRCINHGINMSDNAVVCNEFKYRTQTNSDRIRAMTDEEIEKWYWWMHKEMMYYTDSHHFLHDWLKQEAE